MQEVSAYMHAGIYISDLDEGSFTFNVFPNIFTRNI